VRGHAGVDEAFGNEWKHTFAAGHLNERVSLAGSDHAGWVVVPARQGD